jgi:hypothetical protein
VGVSLLLSVDVNREAAQTATGQETEGAGASGHRDRLRQSRSFGNAIEKKSKRPPDILTFEGIVAIDPIDPSKFTMHSSVRKGEIADRRKQRLKLEIFTAIPKTPSPGISLPFHSKMKGYHETKGIL